MHSPGGLLRSGTDCRGKGLSHSALVGVIRWPCLGRSPSGERSWSTAGPGRPGQTRPRLRPAGGRQLTPRHMTHVW